MHQLPWAPRSASAIARSLKNYRCPAKSECTGSLKKLHQLVRILPPFGLRSRAMVHPGLTPWATVQRRFAAERHKAAKRQQILAQGVSPGSLFREPKPEGAA